MEVVSFYFMHIVEPMLEIDEAYIYEIEIYISENILLDWTILDRRTCKYVGHIICLFFTIA